MMIGRAARSAPEGERRERLGVAARSRAAPIKVPRDLNCQLMRWAEARGDYYRE